MDIEERIKALEDELRETKEELDQILLDIRAHLMEVQTPLRADLNVRDLPEQSDSEKGVESDGS